VLFAHIQEQTFITLRMAGRWDRLRFPGTISLDEFKKFFDPIDTRLFTIVIKSRKRFLTILELISYLPLLLGPR
jgi:hypothetical protein